MVTSWERSADGQFELAVDRETTTGRLIAAVRHARNRDQIVATATPDAVAYHVSKTDALAKAVEAALQPYFAALAQETRSIPHAS